MDEEVHAANVSLYIVVSGHVAVDRQLTVPCTSKAFPKRPRDAGVDDDIGRAKQLVGNRLDVLTTVGSTWIMEEESERSADFRFRFHVP